MIAINGKLDGATVLAAFVIFFGTVVIVTSIINEIIKLNKKNKRGKRK